MTVVDKKADTMKPACNGTLRDRFFPFQEGSLSYSLDSWNF
jgi:hypothetical protein